MSEELALRCAHYEDILRTVCFHLELPQTESGPADDVRLYDRALEDADVYSKEADRDLAKATALRFKLEAEVYRLRQAADYIAPYLMWTVGPECPYNHPAMPTAVSAFLHSFDIDTNAKRLARTVADMRGKVPVAAIPPASPPEYPDDIVEAAEAAWEASFGSHDADDNPIGVLMAALMAERERSMAAAIASLTSRARPRHIDQDVASTSLMWARMHEGKAVADIVAHAIQAERDFQSGKSNSKVA